MYKVLLCEDDVFAKGVINYLVGFGYEVTLADNLADAEYYITESPGADYYDMLLLDLGMSPIDLPEKLQERCKNHFAGWVFYKYIVSLYPNLKRNTVFCTGSVQSFRDKIGNEYENLYVLSKSNPKILEEIKNISKELSKEKSRV